MLTLFLKAMAKRLFELFDEKEKNFSGKKCFNVNSFLAKSKQFK